jgi:hypothetical protein
MALLLQSCDKDSCTQAPTSGTTDGGYDPVFNADGGFIITYGMLDKRYNEITFPGTHNSYSSFYRLPYEPWCRNQYVGISEQMNLGIRYIELDVNDALNVDHGDCPDGEDILYYFGWIIGYASDHPHQVITVRISGLVEPLTAEGAYWRINERIEQTDLYKYVYNWNPTVPNDDRGRCYIPDPWPTLGEMIDSGKNVMFLHIDAGVNDETGFMGTDYGDYHVYPSYRAYDLEDLSKLALKWAPLAKYQETDLFPDDRVVNFIIIDYFAPWGNPPINIVDACNRLNFERFGIDWQSSEGCWELYPYEFDDSRVEHISQVSALKAEVEGAIADFHFQISLDGHEVNGKIVSTGCQNHKTDWKRLPEWAVDGDFFTRWCGSDNTPGHTWGIDLGESKPIDEIAFAWEYPHHRPGYEVWASNDDSKFADGISREELVGDDGWTRVVGPMPRSGLDGLLWDIQAFQYTGTSDWRYIKVKVTDTDSNDYPTFIEVRLYGPAN